MKAITIHDFYSDIKKYINYVLKGEEVMVTDKNKPLLTIEPISHSKHKAYGLCKGEFSVPNNFDNNLPDDIIASFEGK